MDGHALESRPARGAWIEIFEGAWCKNEELGRAPHGARGLKYGRYCKRAGPHLSRPARGAWIEIMLGRFTARPTPSRAPHGARGLKSFSGDALHVNGKSRPARGAWIEIPGIPASDPPPGVAPRTGRVD